MAEWNVSDELDARLRSHLAQTGGDVNTFVEQVIESQLEVEEDADTRAAVLAQIDESLEDINAGRVVDARQAMRRIAADKNIHLDR